MKRLFLLLPLAIFLLAGCTLPGQQQPPDGYLQANNTEVVYIRWTEANGRLSGTTSSTTLQNGKIVTHDLPFTGILNDSTGAISITITMIVITFEAHGTLQNNVLNLQTQMNGQSMHNTFLGVSDADYQTALNAFKAKHR